MIIKGSFLNVSDNSGARLVKCIHIFGRKRYGVIGDYILVTVKTYNPKKKIKKGEIHLSMLIRTKSIIYIYNRYISFFDNAVILLNKKFLPLGTRLFGSSIHNIRFKNRKVFLMLPHVV